MAYDIVSLDAVPTTDLATDDSVLPDMEVQIVSDVLESERFNVRIWHFEPGDEIGYHAHTEQEELYYVAEGQFSLKLGPADDVEYVEVGPGTFYTAGPLTGHGHRCIGDGPGMVFAFGTPPIRDPGLDPHELDKTDN